MPNTLQETKSTKNRLIISSKQNDLKSEFSSITNIPGFVIAKDVHSSILLLAKITPCYLAGRARINVLI